MKLSNSFCCPLSRLLFSLVLCIGSTAGFLHAEEPTDNLVSMVTYFPVPYAAYNNIYVSERLDVGLVKDGTFTLNVGNTSCNTGNPSLQAEDAILHRVGSSGSLILDMPVLISDKVFFGKVADSSGTDVYENANLEFSRNLLIGSIQNNGYSGTPVDSISGHTVRVLEELYLFSASASLPKTCTNTISWKNLEFTQLGDGVVGKAGHYFLVCGEGE